MTGILREYLQSICILLAFLVPLVVFHISKKYVQATGERTEGRIATPSAGLVPVFLSPASTTKCICLCPNNQNILKYLKYFYYRSVSSSV